MILRDFQHDPGLRASFNVLARETFGIDFEAWYQRGFWDDSYVCHAWVEGDQVVATVGTTDMELRIDGGTFHTRQIGTVMTRPDRRGRGLSSRLMEAALAGADRAFLFANEGAMDFYPRFGFRKVSCCAFWMRPDAPAAPAVDTRPLVPERPEDLAFLHRLAGVRAPVSGRLSVHAPALLLWYALNPLREAFFQVPGEDLAIAGCRQGTVYHLFDVVAPSLPAWEDLSRCLPLEGVERLVFHFTPDRIAPRLDWQPCEEDVCFVRGDLPFGTAPFAFPCTAQA